MAIGSSSNRRGKELTVKEKRLQRQRKNATEEAAARVGIIGDNAAPSHDHSTVLTADGQINVSQSKVRVYRQCRRMYHNKFVLGLRRKKIKRPFMFGTMVHNIIEAHLEGKDWHEVLDKVELDNKKLFRKEIEMYGNIVEDIRDIMTDYFIYWGDDLKALKHDGRRSEHEFRIELDDGLWFTGKIDMIGRSKGMRWLVEHKTFARMPSDDDRWRSVQGAVYFRGLEMMGFKPFDGVLWDYVSSKAPNVPGELTATGKISQARIDTVPARVKRWMKAEGHKKSAYPKLLADAEANLRNRFIRVYSPVKPQIVDTIWEDFVDTAREMKDFHGRKKDQNIGRHCSWCDYQALCKAEATGSDLEWLIEREYQTEDLSHKRDDKDRSDD
jgi:hypothetical protein